MARVALVVHAGGRHVPSYLEAIRDIPTITDAVIVDADGSVFDQAKEVIGEKLHETYQSLDEMLQSHHPAMAIVTASGRQSPPLIRPVLDAGIHVVAEKPACLDPNDFAALTDLADKRQVHLMLALSNRLAPWVEDARRIQQQRGIGDLYAVRGMTLADQTRIWDPKRRDWSFSKSEAGPGHDPISRWFVHRCRRPRSRKFSDGKWCTRITSLRLLTGPVVPNRHDIVGS